MQTNELPPLPDRSVDIVVERQWHIGIHARALAWPYRVFGGFPGSRYVAAGIPGRNVKAYPLPALYNWGISRFGLKLLPSVNEPACLARRVAQRTDLASYVICYATAYRWLFPKIARARNILVVERGSTHPQEYRDKVDNGRIEAGLSIAKGSDSALSEEIRAGGLAHFVVSGSDMITASYTKRGVPAERVLTIAYGIDPDLFAFRTKTRGKSDPLRLACVGIIGVRKGLWRLLRIGEWAARRQVPVEIHLIGPFEPEATQLIGDARVKIISHGVKKGAELVQALHQADIYCLPSYEEGFGISVIEAMSTGLPAVVSSETGASEAISAGIDGEVVHGVTDEELDRKLLPLLRDERKRLEMGKAARDKVLGRYTETHYAIRLKGEYERMFCLVEDAARTGAQLARIGDAVGDWPN